MAFPSTPLPVHVYIAPGANPAGDPGGWTWEEITDDVRVAEGIVIGAGRADEASRVDPGSCSLSIDNTSGNYAPRNPMGEWYGLLSKNTPLQVRLERGYDTFDRVSASGWGTANSSHTWSHTSASTWTVSGTVGIASRSAANTAAYAILTGANAFDVDLLFAASMPVLPTGAPMAAGAVLRYSDTSNHYRVFTEWQPGGAITLSITKVLDGTFSEITDNNSTGKTATAGSIIWTRVQADGPTIRVRVWNDGSTEPTTWALSTDDATEMTGTGVGEYVFRYAGNTNVGTLSMNFQHFETTSIMFTGTVAEWPIRWDQSGNDCVTSIEAAGVLRRLQQGKAALRSPLYRQLIGYNPAGYWTMEDGSDATSASSAAINGQAASVSNVTFADDDSLPGAAAVVKLNGTDSAIRGRVLRSTGTGFAAMFLMKLAAMPAASTTFIEWSCSGTVKTWRIKGDATTITTEGLSADGTVLTTMNTLYGPAPTLWVAYQVEAIQNGANIEWAMLLHQVGTVSFFAHNGVEPGTVGTITGFTISGSAGMTDAHVAHVYAGADTLPFVNTNFALVSNGYSGELAADRVQRLCDEEGVRVYVEPGTSQEMGRQRTETFLELLYACEDADLGVVYESGAALGYRPQGARLNVGTEAALDFNSGDVADPPEPTDDDQRVRNDITAKRDDGGESRAADEDHIALVGRYDEARELNVASDDQLPDLVGWLLHLGTWDEMRWPRISMDLANRESRIDDWHAMMRPRARFSVSNPPSQAEGDELDLIIEGYTQTLTPYSWDVELACSPARPWDVAEAESDDYRVDTEGSTLSSSATSTATSMSVTSTDVSRWTTDAAEFPFDINVGGERVTVTTISGASNPQTFTVTRSVNGIVTAHTSGTDVRLWSAAHVSL